MRKQICCNQNCYLYNVNEVIEMEILNETNFDSTIASGVVLVDFFADWCGPCKMMSPVLDEIAKEVPEAVIAKVDVDATPDLAGRYGVQAIPNMIIFKDGKAVDQITGFTGKEALINRIKSQF